MKERPIIFSGEMVRAILDGHKTMTRRVAKPKKDGHRVDKCHWSKTGWGWWHDDERGGCSCKPVTCPYGMHGDRLWVKETFSLGDVPFEYDPGFRQSVAYRADTYADHGPIWSPSIHMPRWASRITLEIVSIRVERLQDISEADAAKEGVRYGQGSYELEWMTPNRRAQQRLADFAVLWDSINAKKPGCSWGDNPWVWAVEFERVGP